MKYLILFLALSVSSPLLSQTQTYYGTWTKVNTTYIFDFELTLRTGNSESVSGSFLWTVVMYDEENFMSKVNYQNKINFKAIEYVKGVYNSDTGVCHLKGYKKDDPDNIIALDTYQLKINQNGELGGTTNSNGSWLGRIQGKEIESVAF